MSQIKIKTKFEKRLAGLIDPIISAETEDWRKLAVIGGLSASELEETLEIMSEEERPELRRYLDEYRAEIRHTVQECLEELNESREVLVEEDELCELLWHRRIVCPEELGKEMVIMCKSEDLGKDITGATEMELGKITSKNEEVVRFMQEEEKRHHQKQSWERYLKRLKVGMKPTVDGCKKALEKVPLDSHQEVELRYYLGRAYLISKQFASAETKYRQALALCEKLNWTEGKSPIYSDLGYTCTLQDNLNDAEEWLLKALEINKQPGKSTMMVIDYSRLAVVYRRRKEFDKAEKMARRSLRIAEQHGLEEEMARQHNNLGVIYLHQYKFQKAERMLRKALDINKQLKRPEGIARNYTNLGWVYRGRQDIKKAREYWQGAKELFEKLGMEDMKHEMDRLLADIDE